MSRRFERYVSIEQAAKALKVDVSQLVGMLSSGELHGGPGRPDDMQFVSSTDIELARQRLEMLRGLEGDAQ